MPTPVVTVQNWGDAVFVALTNALNMLLSAIPLVIGALVILIIGWILASIAGRLTTAALSRVGADRLFRQHGENVYGATVTATWSPSVVAGEVVKWLIRLVFLVAAANTLGLTQVSELLNQVILWIPNLVVAAVVLLVAPLLGRFLRGIIETGAGEMGFTNGALLGRLAEYAVIAFAVVIAINQIGIAANLVNTLFVGVVAALSLAFGLAFGLGGRGVAAELTRQWYESSQKRVIKAAESASRAENPAGQPTLAGAPSRARPK
jgi:hypothetical protein